MHDDPLAERLAASALRQVVIAGVHAVGTEHRAGHLGQALRQQVQRRLGWRSAVLRYSGESYSGCVPGGSGR